MLKVFDFKEIFSAQNLLTRKIRLNNITYQALSLVSMGKLNCIISKPFTRSHTEHEVNTS